MRGDTLTAAEAEREKSQQRLDSVRKHVVEPLTEKARHNQFAELVRLSLEGRPRS